jgi:cephalosporin-C deacetylase
MQFDMPLEALRDYRPEREEPDDFDAFWSGTLADARSHDLAAMFEPCDAGLVLQDVYDVTFNGFGGQPIKAWLLIPKHRSGPVPCVVEYIGYGGGRGFPTDWLIASSAGFAHFVMDTRGQGSVWLRGDTPDTGATTGPAHPGFMTRGIESAEDHYYRRLVTDAVRAVEAARSHPDVDGRIVVTGSSQGGGLALAVSGLVDDLTGVYPDQPFLCHYRRAVALTDSTPYSEIAAYLAIHQDKVEQVFRTLSYLDGVNFATRANAPARFTVGLMDVVCPPSTVFAAYNHYVGPKDIHVFPYNGHDMGNAFGRRERLRFLHDVLVTPEESRR